MIRETGYFQRYCISGEEVAAFVPKPLPPAEPPIAVTDDLVTAHDLALRALHSLDLVAQMIPSVHWFLYAHVRREAVLTSQIEGTQASLDDLFIHEAQATVSHVPDDVMDVCYYIGALEFARDQLQRPDGLPISMRLMCEVHSRLLKDPRQIIKRPGEIRRSQNWISGTRPGNAAFVPPPPELLPELLSEYEKYIHSEASGLPPLIRIGLLHVQFETLHPFLDGNGRMGRLLIALLLEEWDLLSGPYLYISLFLKLNRSEYYQRLTSVRTAGDWESWLMFFLEGIRAVATEATDNAQRLFDVVRICRERLLQAPSVTVMSLRLFELLPSNPVITSNRAMTILPMTRPTATKAIAALEEAGILVETTGKKRDRVYFFKEYMNLLGREEL